jgi:hypothetical protein
MRYADEWRALAARIQGVVRADEVYSRHRAIKASDSFAVGRKHLASHCAAIVSELKGFRSRFDRALPPATKTAFDSALVEVEKFTSPGSGGELDKERVSAAVVLLAAFEAELTHRLSDAQEAVYARSERAFTHLKRLIAVDDRVRGEWNKAFDDAREEACEELGALHLLWHGIWSFKVHAAGARTDLVLTEPLKAIAQIERSADGLVLTEWKKAKPDSASKVKFAEARGQADRYAGGALAANELRNYRYAVVVTKKDVVVPEDHDDGKGVIYRHINIPIDPDLPSKPRRKLEE